MTGMFGVVAAGVALLDRPATPALVVAGLATTAGWAYHAWSLHVARPRAADAPDDPAVDRRPPPLDGHHIESPAVVALLTNGFRVPSSAITATALDLASRGWVRIAVVDDDFLLFFNVGEAVQLTLPPQEYAPAWDVVVDTGGVADNGRSYAAGDTVELHERSVLVLRHVEGLADEAIADVLGCSVATVRTHAARGRERLRMVLSESTRAAERNAE